MKTPHTPGPWSASIGKFGATVNIADDYNHPLTFNIHWGEWFPGNKWKLSEPAWEVLRDEGQANARLSAAGPDMLEALKAAEVELRELETSDALFVVRAAIAKAEGDAP